MNTMSALVYEAPESMVMRTVDIPELVEGEVLIQVVYSGICGSELSGFLGQSSIRRPPLIFGHEIVGRVVELGPGIHHSDMVTTGCAVVINPLSSCGACYFCARGKQQLCKVRQLLGASRPGGNAQFVAVPIEALHFIADNLDLQVAALAEPAACAVHAVRVAQADAQCSALVVGAGPIGLFILKVLAEYGVTPIWIAERNEARSKIAQDSGGHVLEERGDDLSGAIREETEGRGVHLAFDAVGSASSRLSCMQSVMPGGAVILSGLHTDETSLPLNSVVRSEISLTGAFAYTPGDFETALNWLGSGRLSLDSGVLTAPLGDGQQWYERLIAGDPVMKVLLEP